MTAPHVLMLTGAPGVGKTTVICRLAALLAPRALGGFYTADIRERGTRRGFRLHGFDGSECLLAHVDLPGPPRVSKYGVDVAALDASATTLLAPQPEVAIYLVDEVGKMECFSERFIVAMRALLDSGKPVVATVARTGAGFIEEVKRRNDVEIREVTRSNRDRLPAEVAAWLATHDVTAASGRKA
jgi:nucleoside-triphosphatase